MHSVIAGILSANHKIGRHVISTELSEPSYHGDRKIESTDMAGDGKSMRLLYLAELSGYMHAPPLPLFRLLTLNLHLIAIPVVPNLASYSGHCQDRKATWY